MVNQIYRSEERLRQIIQDAVVEWHMTGKIPPEINAIIKALRVMDGGVAAMRLIRAARPFPDEEFKDYIERGYKGDN